MLRGANPLKEEATLASPSDFDIPALYQAYDEIRKLEELAIERTRLHFERHGGTVYFTHRGRTSFADFRNGNGYSVRINLRALLDENTEELAFVWTDEHHGRTTPETVLVPRNVVFGDMSEEEEEFREYKRLEAKFAKK